MNSNRSYGGMVAGLLLIVIGVLFLGRQLGWNIGWEPRHIWPFGLMAWGAATMLNGKNGRRFNTWGLMIMLSGVCALLNDARILRYEQSWPFYIIGFGIIVASGSGAAARIGIHRRRRNRDFGSAAPADVTEVRND